MREKFKVLGSKALKATAVVLPLLGGAQANASDSGKMNITLNKFSESVNSNYDSRMMRIGGDAPPPREFANFCSAYPEQCMKSDLPETLRMKRKEGNDFDLLQLREVHKEFAKKMTPVSDQEEHGSEDVWTLSLRGDCEEYVNNKRAELIKRGWLPGQLLVTFVRTGTGEGHAVLTARTAKGDFVLDNLHEEVLLWSELAERHGYKFISRQSSLDPQNWTPILASKSSS